jgi:hypothetical protein
MYMCPIPNGSRDGASSLYSSRIVNKKNITYCFHGGPWSGGDPCGGGVDTSIVTLRVVGRRRKGKSQN